MTTIGLIGSGNMATAIAARATSAGHDVVLSNRRGPSSLEPLVAELGPLARAASVEEAGGAGEIVVLAVPFSIFDSLPTSIAAGAMLIDATNYYHSSSEPRPPLDSGELTSSELVQRHFTRTRVVKAFNTIPAQHVRNLARNHDAEDRTAIPIASDTEASSREASALLDTLGFDSLAVGPLAASWKFAPGTPAFVSVYQTDPSISHLLDPGRPASRAAVRAAIDAAKR